MRICGIDNGIKGGLAFADQAGVFALEVMPEHTFEIISILDRYQVTHVYQERAQSMPGNKAQSMFNYGTSYGIIQGIVATKKLSLRLVRPQEWTKAMHMGSSGGDPKARSLEVALRLFPQLNFMASQRSKKPHDGLIDAALIAEFGRRELCKK